MTDPLSCAAAAGAVFVTCLISLLFGPHIGIAEFFGALIGAGFYVARNQKNPDTDSNAAIAVVSFLGTMAGALIIAQGLHALVTANSQFAIPRALMPTIACLLGFLLQPLGEKLFNAIGDLEFKNSFPFFGFRETPK